MSINKLQYRYEYRSIIDCVQSVLSNRMCVCCFSNKKAFPHHPITHIHFPYIHHIINSQTQ